VDFPVACLPAAWHHATVTGDPLLEPARRLWADLAGTPSAGREPAVDVAVSARSLLCPPGWVGLVGLGGVVIATAPDDDTAEIVRRALGDLPATAVTDPAVVTHALDAGLLPQWRARPEASRRVARALGFRELGSQLSIRLLPTGAAEGAEHRR
jgi:hypothetical protein